MSGRVAATARAREPWPRREWLTAIAAGIVSPAMLIETVEAMSKLPPGRSIYKLSGTVLVNGKPATEETPINAGDTIETKDGAELVFAVGASAFMVRENSRVELSGAEKVINALRLVTGKLLSVYGKGNRRRVSTPTATIGIRGTGIYLEAEPERTYLCTCYGEVELQAADAPDVSEVIATKHHESPRYLVAVPGGTPRIEPAPIINHTDAELVLIESLVGRTPPFAADGADGGGY